MEILFNMNYPAKVRLTEFGMEIMQDRENYINHLLQKPDDEYVPKLDENGYVKFQLWELMQIFGEHISMGSKIPFKDNSILLCDKL